MTYAKPAKMSSKADRERPQVVGVVSLEDRRAALKSLESRMVTGKIVLARLEEKLDTLMKELESKEKELESDKATGEERSVKRGDDRDRSEIAQYNARIWRYNKLLADAREASAECDSLRQQNQELATQYRKLAGR